SVTKHQSLVAGALFGRVLAIGRARVDTLRNVGRLFGDDILDVDLVGVKNIVFVHVTDFANSFAHDLVDWQNGGERFVLGQIRNRNFAADDDDVAFRVSFASDPTMSILRDTGIENGVRNSVANFVGVTFTDRFGRKNVT